MSKTVEISFFDPRNIPAGLLVGNVVVKVEKVINSNEYIVTFKDGSTKTLPTTEPADPDEIVGAEIVEQDLIILMRSGNHINVGRIVTNVVYPDLTPIGTGILRPGSNRQFKEVVGQGALAVIKTATDVTIKYDGAVGGSHDALPGEFDFGACFIGERVATNQDQIDATRTLWVDDISTLADSTWHDYVFNNIQRDTLAKYSAGVFQLDAGQYYIDFIFPYYNGTYMEVRLQDVTNDITLMTGSSGRGVTTNNSASGNLSLQGDFILTANASVKIQFYFTGSNKKWLTPFTRRSANTEKTVGGQIFLTKVAEIADKVNSIPLTPRTLAGSIAALKLLAETNPTGILSNIGIPTGDTIPTHATTQQFLGVITAKNGIVYFIPSNAANVIGYDPATHQAKILGNAVALVGTAKFAASGAEDKQGRIYLAPKSHSEFLRIITKPTSGWIREPILNSESQLVGYSLFGPGLVEVDPQLSVVGPAPDNTYGTLLKCFAKNRPVGSANYHKATSTSELGYELTLKVPTLVKGMRLINSTHNQVASFDLYGYNQSNALELIARVNNGKFSTGVNMPAGSKLIAVNPELSALYQKLKLVITGGNSYEDPTGVILDAGNFILPMTANAQSGQTASASSSFDAGYLPYNAFGASNSVGGWISSGDLDVTPAAPAWIQIDLGKKVQFDSVTVANRNFTQYAGYAASPKDFKVLGWNTDTESWDVLLTVVGKTNNTPGVMHKYYRIGDFEYQIIRVEITAVNLAPSPRKYVAVGKIEVFKAPLNLITPMYENTDKGQVITASEQYDGTTPIYNAFGETPNWSGWVSSNRVISPAAPAWIEIDMGKVINFNSFALSNRGYNTQANLVGSPNTFQLLGWDEVGAKWDTLLSITGRTDNVAASTTRYELIGDFNYRKVRLNITGRNGTSSGNYVCVGKIELYKGAAPGGSVAIDTLDLITDTQEDNTYPFGYLEKIASSDTTANKYSDVVYCPISNKVIYIPEAATSFGLFDPVTSVLRQETFGQTLAGVSKMIKGVYSPLSKSIYCLPGTTQGFVVILDLVEKRSKIITITRPTTPASNIIWNDAFIGVDGRVYFSPMYGPEWLVIDPLSNTYWFEYFKETGGPTLMPKGAQGAYGADGSYYSADIAGTTMYQGIDTLRKSKKKLSGPALVRSSIGAFSDKFGNVYFLNGISSAELIKLDFGGLTPIDAGIYTAQLS